MSNYHTALKMMNLSKIPFFDNVKNSGSPVKIKLEHLENFESDGDNFVGTFSDGYVKFDKDGMVHSEDGPAYSHDGYVVYSINGVITRSDGPAVFRNSTEMWYKDGKLHREDGPAYYNDDVEEWYYHSEVHREDGPAVYHKRSGTSFWYKNNKIHREDGAAVYDGGKPSRYCLNSVPVGPKFKAWCKERKIEFIEENFPIFAFEYAIKNNQQ